MPGFLDDLDLFYRDITPSQAQVYARLPLPDDTGVWQLTGQVRGPFTRRGHTLPSNAPLVDLGAPPQREVNGTMLARATIIDPCTWFPDAPHLYALTAVLERAGRPAETIRREFGIRDLRPQRTSLFFNAKRWVLRGTHDDTLTDRPADWREASAVRVADSLDEPWLTEAASEGAMAVLRLDAQPSVDVQLMRRLARFTALAIVVLPNPVDLPTDIRLAAPNLLLAQVVDARRPPAAWAHVAWIDILVGEPPALEAHSFGLPVIAARRGRFDCLAAARAACDALQADLAPLGQFAGYVV